MKTKFKSQNWKTVAATNPYAIPFLIKLITELKFSRLLIRVGDYVRPTGGAKKINLVVHTIKNRNVPANDYELVKAWMKKKGLNPHLFPDWQWEILHAFAHAILDRTYQAKKRAFRRNHGFINAGAFRQTLKRPRPHGNEFRRTLMRLAEKYFDPTFSPKTMETFRGE